jgi:hypothetical protein
MLAGAQNQHQYEAERYPNSHVADNIIFYQNNNHDDVGAAR